VRTKRSAYAAIFGSIIACSEPPPSPRSDVAPSADAARASSNEGSVAVGSAVATTATASATTATSTAPVAASPDARVELEAGDRIYAKARFTWIKRAPSVGNGWIGYLTLGGSVRLFEGDRTKARTMGPGCNAWYRVEPMGFICEGDDATLNPNDPDLVRLSKGAPKVDRPYPYAYVESLGAPRYNTIPTKAEQAKREVDLDKHKATLASILAGGARPAPYADIDLTPSGRTAPDLPEVLRRVREPRNQVIRGSTIAYFDSFDAEGRTWLVTSDHAIVPKDKTVPYRETTFKGVELNADVRLPIGFIRKKARAQYRRSGDAFEPNGAEYPRLSWVMLTGERVRSEKVTYVETRNEGVWLREDEVAIAEPNANVPFRADEDIQGRRTWLDIRILGGTLVAYEDKTPVFATLIAPGRGGPPVPGHDALSTASTPTGTFRVDGKFKTATMVSSTDDNIVHAEVQFIQNFHGPHALHGAYWHDGWGELKSGGCVNLSPIDSQRVFDWTEPRIPKDWHGMRSIREFGSVTRVVISR
jgi:hypothetical protein